MTYLHIYFSFMSHMLVTNIITLSYLVANKY
ncbi:hypothetical protein F383_00437 [Gossypium arboreum]|uniref:Uncharacterized protein n=1 Tax=Gossypium arboreum TaxID=29729 RepID=A0A0B0NRI5_GOSAR|nr:hypothetical protein F383_00437 [Gossypium arboreum]